MSDSIRAALERLHQYAEMFPVHDTDAILAAAHAALAEQQALSESQRYLLARWGHQPTPPAEGEVGELVVWLHVNAKEWRDLGEYSQSDKCHRAAELLQQFASPPCLVLKPSPEALAALKAAGPGRIELLPDDAQIIEPEEWVEGPSDEELCDLWSWAAAQDHGPWPTQQHCFARAVLARWGHRPGPHDDRGVLPMIISDTGASDEPERERIICASISGGADYINNMPRMLILERITSEGSTYQQYIQEPTPPAEGEVAELVKRLRDWHTIPTLEERARAAELLQQQHPTPVPVSEGAPGAVDIHFEFVVSDADYCTQAGGVAPTYAQALSEGQRYLAQYQQDGPHTLELRRVEVLHPGALPLPLREVE